MKPTERDIQAVKNKPLYSKIYSIRQTDQIYLQYKDLVPLHLQRYLKYNYIYQHF